MHAPYATEDPEFNTLQQTNDEEKKEEEKLITDNNNNENNNSNNENFHSITVDDNNEQTAHSQGIAKKMSSLFLSLPLLSKSKKYSQLPADENNKNNNNNNSAEENNRKDKYAKSRLDITTFKMIQLRLHVSYLIAIVCIVATFLLYFIVSFFFQPRYFSYFSFDEL